MAETPNPNFPVCSTYVGAGGSSLLSECLECHECKYDLYGWGDGESGSRWYGSFGRGWGWGWGWKWSRTGTGSFDVGAVASCLGLLEQTLDRAGRLHRGRYTRRSRICQAESGWTAELAVSRAKPRPVPQKSSLRRTRSQIRLKDIAGSSF